MIQILEELKGAKSIAVSGHKKPDGDCVGSVLAMYQYLTKMLPDVTIKAFLEPSSSVFSCIKGFDEIITEFDSNLRFDVCIVLDCADERMGIFQEYFNSAAKTINIDHHISNPGCGTKNYIVPEASSTCELVFDLLGEDALDAEIAKAIYIGMIHDCGVFQYSNTSPKTLRIAAKLLEFGFDFPQIIDETFYEKTYVQTQILGRALLESILFMDRKCVVSAVDRKTMHFYHASPVDLDGIVNQLRNIKGVECAIFMYELDLMKYKVSLRSNGKVDVSKIAVYFGGGGHVRAAGCTMQGNFYDVVNNLAVQIEKQI